MFLCFDKNIEKRNKNMLDISFIICSLRLGAGYWTQAMPSRITTKCDHKESVQYF